MTANSVKERLEKVIFVDLFLQLKVYSIQEIGRKFNKLSDWVEMKSYDNAP